MTSSCMFPGYLSHVVIPINIFKDTINADCISAAQALLPAD